MKHFAHTLLLLMLFSLVTAIPSFGQNLDSLNILYNKFANASGKDRISSGRDIVGWLDDKGYRVDSLLYGNTLTDKEFELRVLDWTTRYLFRFEFYTSSLEGANELIKLSEAANYTFGVMMGNYYAGFIHQRFGNMDKGLSHAQRCYDLSIACGDETMESSVLNNIGNIYMVNGQDSMAVFYFQKSYELERKLDRKLNQAVRLGNMATCYMKLNMLDKALECALEGIELDLLNGRPDKLAIRYYQAGEVYTAMGNYEKAKEFELQALEYFNESDSPYGQSYVLAAIGSLEASQQKHQSAIQYYNQALSLAESIDNNLLIQQICNLLYISHRKTNPALSLEYFERNVALKDSIFHAENQIQLNDFRVKYETAEKQLEIERQQTEIKRQKTRQFIYIGGLIAAGLLLTMLAYNIVLRIRRNRELAEMNAIKDKFFSIISHDLKNPAVAQRDALTLLAEHADKWDPNRLSAYYRNLLKSANGLVDLLSNLLNWAKMQTGREVYRPVSFNLIAALQPDMSVVKSLAERKNITFEAVVPKSAIITGDENMLITVVRNLLTNAVKFTETGGTVTLDISSGRDDGTRGEAAQQRDGKHSVSTSYTVSVTDTGTGMTPEQQQNLFRIDRQQTREGTAGEQSSGLGLIVCHDMLQKHGSTLYVESEAGKGSRFWFELKVEK